MKRIVLLCILPWLPFAGNAGDVFKGQELYQVKCVLCHGEKGEGNLINMPNFSRGESIMKPEDELVKVIKNGKGTMPGFVGQLKDQQIYDVIAYIRSLY